MKNISRYYLLLLLGLLLVPQACFNDLDTIPIDDDEITSATVYENPDSYKQVLAKLYGGLALTGQEGPAGDPDISGVGEGFGNYLRMYFYPQELATDEAVIGWNDQTIKDFHEQDWDANDIFVSALYSRIFYQVSLANEFLRETTEEKLNSRGVDGQLRTDIGFFRAEARFMRALSYWHALDLFRNVPFVTEENVVGAFFPEQIQANDLFDFIEGELLEIETQLVPARQNEYGRADQAAAWALLTKLYLNAEVYTGTPRYTDVITYANKIIDAGYTLDPVHANLFKADNNNSNEIIFPVVIDGLRTQSYGATTFLVHACTGGSMVPLDYGHNDPWSGLRVTSAIVNKFPAVGGSIIVAPNPGNTGYPVIYVPGGYQGWDPANPNTVLASPNVDGRYEGYLYFPADNLQFKFTDGPAWDVNYGDTGNDGTLDPGGDNITAPGEGMYKIDVDLNTLTYTLLKTDWGIIGSATPGGWDSDQNMTYDPATNSWNIQLNLVAGEFKFRANDDWGLNYGDNGPDALLERDGGNIAIANAGNYKISLFLDKPDHTYSVELASFDKRAQFYTDGQSLEINDISTFTEGYALPKFINLTSTGQPGSDPYFVDTDFPMFRLADVYLMYAEAVLRGGSGGSTSQALEYVNLVRERAFGDASGNLEPIELTLDFLIDERARELMWESHRRTDLVRFGKFSSTDYLWPWKGGVPEGRSVSPHYDVLPIPASDLGANPNLRQNEGY